MIVQKLPGVLLLDFLDCGFTKCFFDLRADEVEAPSARDRYFFEIKDVDGSRSGADDSYVAVEGWPGCPSCEEVDYA